MRRLMGMSVGLLLTLGLGGCPTTFSGNAYVAGGRAGCEQMCKKSKLKMSGMVFLGEYSSACICELPSKPDTEAKPAGSAGAGATGGAVSVMLQTAHAEGSAPTPVYSTRATE